MVSCKAVEIVDRLKAPFLCCLRVDFGGVDSACV
jgi:hypothetical protein